jgi:tetratricopeptide (TPR) repeat protein
MSQELDELVRAAYQLPYGRAKSALLEQVVARAEAEGEEEAAFEFRVKLAFAYSEGGEPRLSFTPFGRCVADLDADPQRFAQFRRSLLWGYKSIVHSMTYFPEIGLQQTLAMLDEMERRYVDAGFGLHAVHEHRWLVAHHLGDREAAEGHFRTWSATPRDGLSDCIGCDPNEKVRHLTWVGQHAEAVALGLQTLAQDLPCDAQPREMQTALLPALVAEGRFVEARDAHQRGYRDMRTRSGQLPGYAAHLRFATATGNLDRAQEILARHVHELAEPRDPFSAMEFQAVATRLLTELVDADPTAVVDDEHGAPTDAAVLAERYAAAARGLAARFDARNETTHQSERVEHLLTEDRWVDHLPLLALPSAPAQVPAPVPVEETSDDVDPTRAGVVPTSTAAPEASRPPRTKTLPEPADVEVDALLDLVDDALRERRPDVARAALDRFAEARPEPDRTEQERGRIAYARSELADDDGLGDDARDALRVALIHFDAAGDELRLHRTRATLGLLLAQAGDLDEATATADDALAWLAEHDEPRRRGRWVLQRSMLDRAAGREERAYEAVRTLFAEGSGTLERDEHVALVLAQEELARGRYAEAAGAAERALRSTDPGRWRWSRRFRADARRALGDATGAVDDRLEALAGTAEIPDAASDPRLVLELAEDYLAADRASDAVETGEVALRFALQQPDDPGPLEHARLLLLRGYQALDEPALALEQVLAIEDLMTEDTTAGFRAGLLEEKGELMARLARHSEAVPVFVRSAEAYGRADLATARLRALRWALDCATRDGALEQAAALWQEAYDLGEQLAEDDREGWFHRGWLWIEHGQAELRAGRQPEAVADFTRAEATFHAAGLPDQATEAVLRRAETTGADLDELRGLFVAAAEQSNVWYRSGWLLADRLRAADRAAEADELEARLEEAAA